MKFKETEASYYAGLFDGEGCVGIYLDRSKIYKALPRHYLQVIITNTNVTVLMDLKNQFNGCLTTHKQHPTSWGKKRIYWWRLSGKGAKEFLETIYPYSRIKRQEIEIAIRFQSIAERGARVEHYDEMDTIRKELMGMR